MADVRPFAALRYDTALAGPLEDLVAPPYDVLSEQERDAYRARSAYNVVHLTLPDSEEQAARDFRAWREQGVLHEEAPAFWALEQRYVGPDGVDRTRRGVVVSLKAVPYDERVVLPHERTHAEAKEGRLRLVRAVGAQLEPIFLLYEGLPPISQPEGEPDLEVEGARLWRLAETDAVVEAFRERQLLIADGHHRYETTVEYAQGGGSPWLLAVLVSTSDPGLTIFPTHRTASRFDASNTVLQADGNDPRAALERLPADRSGAVVYTPDRVLVAEGTPGQLDTQLVESLAPEGVGYTADVDEAVAAVDSGRAQAALPASADEDRGRLRDRAARRGAAAEDDVLLSQAALGSSLPSSVSDWVAICRAAVADARRVLDELPDPGRARARASAPVSAATTRPRSTMRSSGSCSPASTASSTTTRSSPRRSARSSRATAAPGSCSTRSTAR